MPYDVSCGAGMVDTANVPNCSDDTSGESCLIPATSAPAPEYKFTATTTSNTSSFYFYISAAGTFYVDWGDGTTETIEKPDTTITTYSHNYSTKGKYIVKIGGLATAYNSSRTVASISFNGSLKSIDGSLGAIFPTLADGGQPSFYHTFIMADITSIPETLFSGVTGNAPYMFSYTFSSTSITSIPENLFAGITGAAEGMFEGTFSYNSITSIPEKLFAGVTGAAAGMFGSTFSDSGITSIPENLFSGVTGAAESMFERTFEACYSLTSIPENLFSGVTGAAESMFRGTFLGSYITSIPENLFSGITGAAEGMFFETFAYCDNLTGPSARINGKPLYELWPDNIADWGVDMYTDATGLDDYACIPTVMGGGGEECAPAPEYKFSITIGGSIYGKESWGFGISAAGTFYVDWGDGNTEKIEKTDTQYEAYIHDYNFDYRSYTIRIGGVATAYSDDNFNTIDFSYVAGRFITEINGSLGAVFPTLPDGSQPNFGNCFRNAKITEIPAELFNGIYGAPIEGMFQNTFYSNSNLVSIPENLFSGITGNAPNMFTGTFSASGITSIPENLFAGITGAAEDMFYDTFSASNITSIPENLFSGITGAAAGMFESTFSFCPSLTSIPENLFSGVTGAADRMFSNTFGHSGITSIPENLFSGITGNAPYMFVDTFLSSGITSIPENLFSGITGAAEGMFRSTFANCSNLTGPSARINGKYLYDLWPDNVAEWGLDMYAYATGLDDYAYIPVIMGGLGQVREQLCTIGISQIKISTGVSFALYAEKYTQPSLAIKYNDGICYGKLEQGNQSGTMNFNYNGTVYHLAN